jgi:hypothetical protein
MITLILDMMPHNPVYISAFWWNLCTTLHGIMSQKTIAIALTSARTGNRILHPTILSVLACSGMTGNVRWNQYLKVEIVMQHRASHLVF